MLHSMIIFGFLMDNNESRENAKYFYKNYGFSLLFKGVGVVTFLAYLLAMVFYYVLEYPVMRFIRKQFITPRLIRGREDKAKNKKQL